MAKQSKRVKDKKTSFKNWMLNPTEENRKDPKLVWGVRGGRLSLTLGLGKQVKAFVCYVSVDLGPRYVAIKREKPNHLWGNTAEVPRNKSE